MNCFTDLRAVVLLGILLFNVNCHVMSFSSDFRWVGLLASGSLQLYNVSKPEQVAHSEPGVSDFGFFSVPNMKNRVAVFRVDDRRLRILELSHSETSPQLRQTAEMSITESLDRSLPLRMLVDSDFGFTYIVGRKSKNEFSVLRYSVRGGEIRLQSQLLIQHQLVGKLTQIKLSFHQNVLVVGETSTAECTVDISGAGMRFRSCSRHTNFLNRISAFQASLGSPINTTWICAEPAETRVCVWNSTSVSEPNPTESMCTLSLKTTADSMVFVSHRWLFALDTSMKLLLFDLFNDSEEPVSVISPGIYGKVFYDFDLDIVYVASISSASGLAMERVNVTEWLGKYHEFFDDAYLEPRRFPWKTNTELQSGVLKLTNNYTITPTSSPSYPIPVTHFWASIEPPRYSNNFIGVLYRYSGEELSGCVSITLENHRLSNGAAMLSRHLSERYRLTGRYDGTKARLNIEFTWEDLKLGKVMFYSLPTCRLEKYELAFDIYTYMEYDQADEVRRYPETQAIIESIMNVTLRVNFAHRYLWTPAVRYWEYPHIANTEYIEANQPPTSYLHVTRPTPGPTDGVLSPRNQGLDAPRTFGTLGHIVLTAAFLQLCIVTSIIITRSYTRRLQRIKILKS